MSLHDDFPDLGADYAQTSPATPDYNCIAWAAGRQDDWWWPDPAFVSYWPEQAPRAETLDAFYEAFASLGYERCADSRHEPGFEKVALYALDGKPKHAARQLPDGSWTSKLGEDIDIGHALTGLEGALYGRVVGHMRRPLERDSAKQHPSSRFVGVAWILLMVAIFAAVIILSYFAIR